MADQTTTFRFEAQDNLSKTLKRIKKNAERTFGKGEKATNEYNRAVRKATSNTGRLNKRMKGVQSTGIGLGRTLTRLGGAFAAAFGVREVFNLGTEMEKIRISFDTILGSKAKGGNMVEQLNEFANRTPYVNEQVLKTGKILTAAGIEAQDMTKTMQRVGDVAAGAGVPLQDMGNIYAKAMNKGKVQAEELNQMAERGVPILKTFADMFNVSKQEVMEMGSTGALTADKLSIAFDKMTSKGGVFFNLMEKQSETVGGKLSTIVGRLQLKFIDLFNKAAPTMLKILNKIEKNFDKIFKGLKEVVKYFLIFKGTILLTKGAMVAYTIATNLMKFAQIALSQGIRAATTATKAFNTAMKANVIGLAVSAIVGLVSLFKRLSNKTDEAAEAQKRYNRELENSPIMRFLDKAGAVSIEIPVVDARGVKVGSRKDEYVSWQAAQKNIDQWMEQASLQQIKGLQTSLESQILETRKKLRDASGGSLIRETLSSKLENQTEILRALKDEISAVEGEDTQDLGIAGEEGVSLSSSRIAKNLTINIDEVVSENGININSQTFEMGTEQMKDRLEEVFRDLALNLGTI